MTTNMTDTEIAALLTENDRRNEIMYAHFDVCVSVSPTSPFQFSGFLSR